MNQKLLKGIILLFVFAAGAGILFSFGMTYFLKEKMGIESPGLSGMAAHLPPEFSFVKWIIIGALALMVLIKVLVWGGIGWFSFKALRKHWGSMDRPAEDMPGNGDQAGPEDQRTDLPYE